MADDFGAGGLGPKESGQRSTGRGAGSREEQRPDDGQPLDLIEISGRIKWFDVAKGFGFIVPDNGMADVLLHVTCLRRDGYQTANEGARIVCEAVQKPRGLQAFRIISLDDEGAIHAAQLPQPRTRHSIVPTSGLERAVVKWFNRLRGFGFLTRGDDTP